MRRDQAGLRALKRAFPGQVDTNPGPIEAHGLDSARLIFPPAAVVRVKQAGEVGRVLVLANRYRVPVTVRGGGSATTGAASPREGGWLLDMRGLRKITIDSKVGLAWAEAGAITEDLCQRAEKCGWFYPPDPSSKAYSTIGGNLATNAGGLRGAKYGVTRDYVLALEGFLATGEPVRWGAPLRKFASGYNLRDLWVGSEGTLGVITRAALRLIPRPEARQTLLFGFRNERQALQGALAVMRARLVPAIMEFLDCQTVGCTLEHGVSLGRPLPPAVAAVIKAFPRPPALLLIELDGVKGEVEANVERLIRLPEMATSASLARSPEEAEALWQIRRTCSQAMFRKGDTKLNEDVVVPPRSYQALLRFTRELRRLTGLATPTFGHVADGNFHVHLMYDHQSPGQSEAAATGVRLLMEKVVALGGAITGEHGIGLAKSAFLRLQHSPVEIEVMQRIKAVLDPNNILNPGKLFEPFEMWHHPKDREAVFPWH